MTSTGSGGHEPGATPTAPTAQADLARLRQTVLAGRGPGASRSEFLEHTRGRTHVGGRTVAEQREAVARDAAAARRDAEELLLHLAADRSRLGADLEALRSRRAASRRTTRAIPLLSTFARPSRLRLSILWIVALAAGRQMWRKLR